jgi:hypothetical protein
MVALLWCHENCGQFDMLIGGRYVRLPASNADAMRAFRLACATAAWFGCLRASKCSSQGSIGVRLSGKLQAV